MAKLFFILTVLFTDGSQVQFKVYGDIYDCVAQGLLVKEELPVKEFSCEVGNLATKLAHSGQEI